MESISKLISISYDKINQSLDDLIENRKICHSSEKNGDPLRKTANKPVFKAQSRRYHREGNKIENVARDKEAQQKSKAVHSAKQRLSSQVVRVLKQDLLYVSKKEPFPSSQSFKLFITNLHYNATESDAKEFFGRIGPLRKVRVNYDKYGRSLGTADIVYETYSDALEAIRQYNGVTFFGRRIRIIGESDMYKPVRRSDFNWEHRRKSRYVHHKENRYSRNRHGDSLHRNDKKRRPTAEELDAELDAYMNEL